MIWWILAIFILAILSFLTNLGILFTLQVEFPFITSTIISVLIILCLIGIIIRILGKARKKEKEALIRKTQELEKELKALKEK